VDELAALMDEFKLAQASLEISGFQVTFRRHLKPPATVATPSGEIAQVFSEEAETAPEPVPEVAKGQPVASPMAGIFFLASSPSSPPFVKLGEVVSAGQTIGLIEAMKVYNEIPSPIAGTLIEILVESGTVVQPGQVLMRVG
jgi:acetyl-CoA carboxylase biotin carboxyl carrier protein